MASCGCGPAGDDRSRVLAGEAPTIVVGPYVANVRDGQMVRPKSGGLVVAGWNGPDDGMKPFSGTLGGSGSSGSPGAAGGGPSPGRPGSGGGIQPCVVTVPVTVERGLLSYSKLCTVDCPPEPDDPCFEYRLEGDCTWQLVQKDYNPANPICPPPLPPGWVPSGPTGPAPGGGGAGSGANANASASAASPVWITGGAIEPPRGGPTGVFPVKPPKGSGLTITDTANQPEDGGGGGYPGTVGQPNSQPRDETGIIVAGGIAGSKTVAPFVPRVHESITKNALSGIGLGDDCLRIIITANWTQDIGVPFIGIGPLNDPRNHGDDNMVQPTIDLMAQRVGYAVQLLKRCGDPHYSCVGIEKAMRLLGQAFHALQDLYSHSTYIEIYGGARPIVEADLDVSQDGVPVEPGKWIRGEATRESIYPWEMVRVGRDGRVTALEVPPGVVTGDWHLFGKHEGEGPQHGGGDSGINKDSASRRRARAKNNKDTTNFQLAEAAATKSTRTLFRQVLEALPAGALDCINRCCYVMREDVDAPYIWPGALR